MLEEFAFVVWRLLCAACADQDRSIELATTGARRDGLYEHRCPSCGETRWESREHPYRERLV